MRGGGQVSGSSTVNPLGIGPSGFRRWASLYFGWKQKPQGVAGWVGSPPRGTMKQSQEEAVRATGCTQGLYIAPVIIFFYASIFHQYCASYFSRCDRRVQLQNGPPGMGPLAHWHTGTLPDASQRCGLRPSSSASWGTPRPVSPPPPPPASPPPPPCSSRPARGLRWPPRGAAALAPHRLLSV